MNNLNGLAMKIDKLEAHDRFLQFTKRSAQSDDIDECCLDMIRNTPFGTLPFYIFAHTRTDDDGFTQRMIWQPRLTKPTAQVNSMLFKVYPPKEDVEVIWIIPKRELWEQYKLGNMTQNKTVLESIDAFENRRQQLEQKEDGDLPDEAVDAVYRSIGKQAREKGTTYQKTILL